MRCKAFRKDGHPCQIQGGGVVKTPEGPRCIWHDESRREQAQQSRRLGRARQERTVAEEMKERSLSTEDLPPLKDHGSAKIWLETVGRAVAVGRLTDRAGQAVIRAVSEWIKTLESEMTAEVVGELKAEVKRLKADLKGTPGLKAVR